MVIHLGICGSSPRGRERNSRTATSSSKTASTILTQLTHAAGEPEELAPPAPARARTITPTIPRPISQPRTKAGPLTLARWLVSISTTAMIGMGLSAIPTASGSEPPMAWPIYPSSAGVPVWAWWTASATVRWYSGAWPISPASTQPNLPVAQVHGQLVEHPRRSHVDERHGFAVQHHRRRPVNGCCAGDHVANADDQAGQGVEDQHSQHGGDSGDEVGAGGPAVDQHPSVGRAATSPAGVIAGRRNTGRCPMWRVTSRCDRFGGATAGAEARTWLARAWGPGSARPDPAGPVAGAGGGRRSQGEVLPQGLLARPGAVCVLPGCVVVGRAWAVPGGHPPGAGGPASKPGRPGARLRLCGQPGHTVAGSGHGAAAGGPAPV